MSDAKLGNGPRCERGPRGHKGHKGHNGPTGATGPGTAGGDVIHDDSLVGTGRIGDPLMTVAGKTAVAVDGLTVFGTGLDDNVLQVGGPCIASGLVIASANLFINTNNRNGNGFVSTPGTGVVHSGPGDCSVILLNQPPFGVYTVLVTPGTSDTEGVEPVVPVSVLVTTLNATTPGKIRIRTFNAETGAPLDTNFFILVIAAINPHVP